MHIRQTYRLYPSNSQKQTLIKWIGCTRYIWNHMLSHNMSKYKNENKFSFYVEMANMLPNMKKSKDTSWIKECPADALQHKLKDLDVALKKSFKHNKNRAGFPKFKAKSKDYSGIRIPSARFKITKTTNKHDILHLPKKMNIPIRLHKPIMGQLKSVTIKTDPSGNWWASFVLDVPDEEIINKNTSSNEVGIDLGLKEFLVTSDGECIDNPKFSRKHKKKTAKLQRKLSKKQKNSNNRRKAKLKLAKHHQYIANKRKDFIKKTANILAKSNKFIAIEDLHIKGMVKNHNLAYSIHDASWSMFISELSWQCIKHNTELVKINRFAPSSKTCSSCGYIQNMPLEIRTYECPSCDLVLDRDINAAINILLFSKTTVGTAGSNACEDSVNSNQSLKTDLVGSLKQESDEVIHRSPVPLGAG